MNKAKTKAIVGKILWILAALAFIFAWVTILRGAPLGPLDPLFLLWNALVLGVLAIPLKLGGGAKSEGPMGM